MMAGKDTLLRWSDRELLEWIDAEAESRDRSRSWLVEDICRMYRKQLEARRQRAEQRKANR